MKYTDREIFRANVLYHSILADTYDLEQPHFKPENVVRVETIIQELVARTGGGALLDLGCGTGFIINLAKRYFQRVVGIDCTPKMLEKVDCSNGNVELCLANTSSLPLMIESFDVCTAYGFLHHLPSLLPTILEAFRCLRKGGIFYADLEPNFYFWQLMRSLRDESIKEPLINQETESIFKVCGDLKAKFGLNEETVEAAEYQKIVNGGFKEDRVRQVLFSAGFSSVDFEYHWYLGQKDIKHSLEDVHLIVENYLKRFLPSTRHLFKYFGFVAYKGKEP